MKSKLIPAILLVLVLGAVFSIATAKSDSEESAWLGVFTQTVDYDLAEAFELSSKYGVIINEVFDDSPAEEAGLEEDDIIVEIDGQKITDYDDLEDILEDSSPGDKLDLTIVRDEGRQTITVELGEEPRRFSRRSRHLPLSRLFDFHSGNNRDLRHNDDHDFDFDNDFDFDFNFNFDFDGDGSGYIGVFVMPVEDQLAEYFGVEDEAVLITSVVEDSPAEEAGLLAGDVIVEIDDEEIEDSGDIRDIVRDMDEGDKVEVTFLRNKKVRTITVTIAEREGRDNVYYFGDGDLDINIPDFRMHVPWVSGLHKGHFRNSRKLFDEKKFQQELGRGMNEMKRELKEMQKELKELRSKLQ